ELKQNDVAVTVRKELESCVDNFLKSLKRKLVKHNRHISRLLEDPWMDETLEIPSKLKTDIYVIFRTYEGNVTDVQGRPKKSFSDLTESGKRKRTLQLRTKYSIEELDYARSLKKRPEETPAAKTTSDIPVFTPFTSEEISAIIKICNLMKSSYLFLRQALKSHGADVFPNYNDVWAGKQVFYPEEKDIQISDSEAKISVQTYSGNASVYLNAVFPEYLEYSGNHYEKKSFRNKPGTVP
ncbi:Proline--tRNA ligase, partial [Frankliniella fusca]